MNANYLSDEYHADIAKVEAIHSLTAKGLGSLARAYDPQSGMWPYSLKERVAITLPPALSIVTNAMTIHAIGISVGSIQDSVLVPGIRRQRSNDKGLTPQAKELYLSGTRDLIDHLRGRIGQKNLTTSGTWGPNDPLTLTWLHELFTAQCVKDDQDAIALVAMLKFRAEKTIRRGFKDPDRYLRKNSGEMGITANPFRLLRLVQLADSIKLLHGSTGGANGNDTISTGALERFLKSTLHTQLSRSVIRNGSFDPSVLTFALEALMLINPESVGTSLVDRVVEVLGIDRSRSTHWRPVRPIHVTKEGSVLLPQSIEVANSYLRIGNLQDSVGTEPLFSKSRKVLDCFADWVTSSIVKVTVRATPELNDGNVFQGWKSEHTHSQGKIDLWATSQVLLFLEYFGSMLQDHIAWSSRKEAKLDFVPYTDLATESVTNPPTPARAVNLASWQTTSKSEPMAGQKSKSKYRVYRTVEERFVLPRFNQDWDHADYSMLLYGPPGTGKTHFARSLARDLGYDFINVTPSDFLKAGEAGVEARAQDLFKVLNAQSDAVILFDEIDRLLLDRESGKYGSQSDMFQFMTPSMLTKLNDLRKNKQSIFIIATNYAGRIDGAIKRPGRIDRQLPFLPPDYERRRLIIANLTSNSAPGWHPRIIAAVARQTPLYVYKEIKEIVRSLQDKGSPLKSRKNFGKDLNELLEKYGAEITLAQYRKLMCKRVGSGSRKVLEPRKVFEKVPWQEFGLLTYLFLEDPADSKKGLHKKGQHKWGNGEEWITDVIAEILDKFDSNVKAVLTRA